MYTVQSRTSSKSEHTYNSTRHPIPHLKKKNSQDSDGLDIDDEETSDLGLESDEVDRFEIRTDLNLPDWEHIKTEEYKIAIEHDRGGGADLDKLHIACRFFMFITYFLMYQLPNRLTLTITQTIFSLRGEALMPRGETFENKWLD